MAEVTVPEETEEEIPTEEETIVVDKPTEKSKVISINFSPLDTKVTTNIDTKEEFFTTDTDAWVVLNINEMSEPTGQYSLALINKDDGSVFQRTGDIVNGVAYYKLIQDEIKHAGRWTGQVVITLDNGRTTASRFNFTVAGHILDGKDVREIVIQDFQTLMAQLNSLKYIADVDLSAFLSSVKAAQALSVANELERQETFNTNESARQVEYSASKTAFDENLTELSTLIEADVVGLAVDEKYGEMEVTYAANLTKLKSSDESIAAQLAQTKLDFETAVSEITVDSEVLLTHNSTTKNKTFTTLDSRLEEIEADNKLKANKIQENWITPTLLNGWVEALGHFGYYKDSIGNVEIQGALKHSSIPINSLIFTLPLGYRPKVTIICVEAHADMTGDIIYILPTGEVKYIKGATAGSSVTWVSLNKIFRAVA